MVKGILIQVRMSSVTDLCEVKDRQKWREGEGF